MQQRIKVENGFSKWENIETSVCQESILGPLSSNILIIHETYFSSYANDNTSLHYQPKHRLCDEITGETVFVTFKMV